MLLIPLRIPNRALRANYYYGQCKLRGNCNSVIAGTLICLKRDQLTQGQPLAKPPYPPAATLGHPSAAALPPRPGE